MINRSFNYGGNIKGALQIPACEMQEMDGFKCITLFAFMS
jgi:hypothetical protein